MCVGGFYVVRLLFCVVVSCCYRCCCCCCCLQRARGLLHEASVTGDCDTARKLLEIGVDVDDRDQVVIYFFVHSFKILLIYFYLFINLTVIYSLSSFPPFESWRVMGRTFFYGHFFMFNVLC